MHRRDILRVLGTTALMPLGRSLLPRQRLAALELLHQRAAAGAPALALSAAQMALVTALADSILPRTSTPGAIDVGVPAFVDLLAAEWYPDRERESLLAGLDALDARCRSTQGKPFAELDATGRAGFLAGVDGKPGEPGSAEGSYRRIKEAIVFGYLTSKPVAELLRTMPITPGRFDGCIPVRAP